MAWMSAIEHYQPSFDELGTPLRDVTFCVLDLETTGGNRRDDLITEIGVVKVVGGAVEGTFQTLINPGRAIPPQITILTGLTDAVVATAPRIDAVLPTLMDFLGDAVFVAHNASFDLGFLRAALERSGRDLYRPTVVDTAALARRVLRDEVPNCRLATLASRLRLDHQPSHRALEDALATTDLLHLLLERVAGIGVTGLDDLTALGKMAGHPQARKLTMTTGLPRTPGVYLFRGHADEVLYVGKATNLRQRVRSYFGSEDRRRIGPMLREMQSIRTIELADPTTAHVVETRLIARLLPRYNRAGTRTDRYRYVRLDVDQPWPRLSIVTTPAATGRHMGPLPSRAAANLVVEAIQSVLPLRRCSTRLGRSYRPPADAVPCAASQLGVTQCPCAGRADADRYAAAVRVADAALGGDCDPLRAELHERMAALASAQRYEDAAVVRDRLQALIRAGRRQALIDALRAAGRVEIERRGVRWTVDGARLTDVAVPDRLASPLPVDAGEPVAEGRPMPRDQVDEAVLLATFFDRHAGEIRVRSITGSWRFPVSIDDRIVALGGDHPDGPPAQPVTVTPRRSMSSTLP